MRRRDPMATAVLRVVTTDMPELGHVHAFGDVRGVPKSTWVTQHRGRAGVRAVRCIDGQPRLVDVEEPSRAGTRLQVRAASICGSDLALLATYSRIGRTIGHEFAGVTDDGRAFAVEPVLRCGECDQCTTGHHNRCRRYNGAILGVAAEGGMAERVIVPDACLVALPPGLPVETACLVEPAAVALHCLHLLGVGPGSDVAVIGGGQLGLVTVAMARALGAGAALEARHPHQREAGERLGAAGPSGEYDVIIDTAGSASGLARAIELAAPGARLGLLGVYSGPLPIDGVGVLMKEITIVPSICYGVGPAGREADQAAIILALRPEIAASVITHRFPLADAEHAFAVAGDRGAGAIKVVLEP